MGKNVLNSALTLSFSQDLADILTVKDEHFHLIFTYCLLYTHTGNQGPGVIVSFGLINIVTTSDPFLDRDYVIFIFFQSAWKPCRHLPIIQF